MHCFLIKPTSSELILNILCVMNANEVGIYCGPAPESPLPLSNATGGLSPPISDKRRPAFRPESAM